MSKPIKVTNVVPDGNLRGGKALRVIGVSDPDRQVSGKVMKVYAIAEGERPIAAGDPIEVVLVDMPDDGVMSGKIQPVYFVSGGPGGGGDDALDAEYLIYEAAMSVQPSSTWRTAASQLFVSLRTALGETSLGDALDIMYILAAETEQAALLNTVNPGTHNATNVNSVAFEASRGMTGNGSSSYLDTNYNPSTQGVNFITNSASMGVYSRTNSIEASGVDMGIHAGFMQPSTRIYSRVTSTQGNIGINDSSSTSFNGSVNSLSLFVLNRASSSDRRLYQAGSELVSLPATSASIPSFTMTIGALHGSSFSSFSQRQYAFAFMGRSMDATEQSDFYDAIQTFMTAIGAEV